jgi:aldose 1-epimerase
MLGSVNPPTGRQLRLEHGEQAATVVEVGAGIRGYSWGGRPVLDGYEESEPASGRRGVPLLPWPNRIQDGRYTFAGEELQLPITQVAEHNAIHGLTSFIAWTVEEQARARARLATTVYPQPGYPFTVELEVVYELGDDGLEVITSARNAGSRPLPFGAGHHPYLSAGGGLLDELPVTVPAATVLAADQRGIPIAARPVAGTALDFRRARALGGARLDHCFTGLERDRDGTARVTFGDLELWMDRAYGYVMLYSGDTLPDARRRRRGLAVEPMTCPPNAFRSGEALIALAPGEACAQRWGLRVRTP